MMPEKSAIEMEMEAIKTITHALEQLDVSARQRVLEYATNHLGIKYQQHIEKSAHVTPPATLPQAHIPSTPHKIVDIRSFRIEKQPSTDTHMAALVAYYISELAPEDLRKETITPKDITDYFKQAGHPIPPSPKSTLANAKNAGYLDSAGHGQYKLNPVGHNLVVHNLPRVGTEDAKHRRKPAKKKQVVTKKTSSKKPKKV